jgi:alpha-tubulin suppressor-like RCC1 family protein
MNNLKRIFMGIIVLAQICLFAAAAFAVSPTAPGITFLPPETYSTFVTVSWRAAFSDAGIERYYLQRSTDSIFINNVTTVDVGKALSYTYNDLAYNTLYYFRVYAKGNDGNPANMNPWNAAANPNGVRWSAITRTRCISGSSSSLAQPILSGVSPGKYIAQDDTYYSSSRNPIITWNNPSSWPPLKSGFSKIAGGTAYSIGLKDDGTVWTWGYNPFGELGDGTITNHNKPVQVKLADNIPLTNIVGIAGGITGNHTIALKSDGTVWTWGNNYYGQLGDGTTTNHSNPVQVKLSDGTPLTNIIEIAGGTYHTIALKNDGTVWTWGNNIKGQLGDGTTAHQSSPVQVKSADGTPLTNIIRIAGGSSHTIALKNDGTVWNWGYNWAGQLGGGTATEGSSSPVQVKLADGTPLANIIGIAGGTSHTIALKNDGTIWTWGDNEYGKLGDGTTMERKNPVQVKLTDGTPLTSMTSIAGGYSHTIAVKNDGTVWAWGYNDSGQLGDGTNNENHYPIQAKLADETPLTNIIGIAAGGDHTIALKNDGSVRTWGWNFHGQLGEGTYTDRYYPTKIIIDPMEASAGSEHSVYLKSDGTVWTWGNNVYGQLGDGTTTNRLYSVQVKLADNTPLTNVIGITAGHLHTTALRTDGTVWAWGSNSKGQLGDGTTVDRPNPIQVKLADGTPLANIIKIAGGYQHTIALKSDGTVWAWGWNGFGQIGDGTSVDRRNAVQVKLAGGTPLTNIIEISGGRYAHTVALKSDGTVWTWGYNGSGRLGDGTTTSRNYPVQVKLANGSPLSSIIGIAGADSHTIALKSDSSVWTWGWNGFGQLGDGTTTDKLNPVQMKLANGTSLYNIISIAGGDHHTIALNRDGTVWACGWNNCGQLGDGTTTNRSNPVQVKLTGSPLTTIIGIAAEYRHTAVLKEDGSVWTWGLNSSGQLGDGTTRSTSYPIKAKTGPEGVSAGGEHSVYLKNDGTVWTWGWNGSGQLGEGTTTNYNKPVQVKMADGAPLTNIIAITGGTYHTIALKNDGTVWTWGNNWSGQLGDGTTTTRLNPVQAKLADDAPLTNIIKIAGGRWHTIALKSDGTVWTWGYNGDGELGDGTTTTRLNPVQVKLADGAALSNIIQIAGGYDNTIALKNDGTVWTWGWNYYGELGDGTKTTRLNPVQAKLADGAALSNIIQIAGGYDKTIALKNGGTVWTWGFNVHGELGDGTTTTRLNPVQAKLEDGAPLTNIIAITGGTYHTIALKNDGTAWTWGYNEDGELGDGTRITRYNPVQVKLANGAPLTNIIEITGGDYYTIALKNDGSVWTWGGNWRGQLGDGTYIDRLNPVKAHTSGQLCIMEYSEQPKTFTEYDPIPVDSAQTSVSTNWNLPDGVYIIHVGMDVNGTLVWSPGYKLKIFNPYSNLQINSIYSYYYTHEIGIYFKEVESTDGYKIYRKKLDGTVICLTPDGISDTGSYSDTAVVKHEIYEYGYSAFYLGIESPIKWADTNTYIAPRYDNTKVITRNIPPDPHFPVAPASCGFYNTQKLTLGEMYDKEGDRLEYRLYYTQSSGSTGYVLLKSWIPTADYQEVTFDLPYGQYNMWLRCIETDPNIFDRSETYVLGWNLTLDYFCVVPVCDNAPVVDRDLNLIQSTLGKPLSFHVETHPNAQFSSVKWDFGDGAPVITGRQVTHSYQKISEPGLYFLVTVIAVDSSNQEHKSYMRARISYTTEGQLYANETWSGTYTLTGDIFVPSGVTLTLKPGMCLKVKSGAGIVVEGELLIQDPAKATTVDSINGKAELWKGIKFTGNGRCNINGLVISHAEQGIVTAGSGNIVVKNSDFIDNLVGLHCLNGVVAIDGCIFSGNVYYGIKEDKGCSPIVTNCSFLSNGMHYYDQERLKLTAEQLNTGSNSGNLLW